MGQSAVDSLQVLTAGIDGQLHLLPLDWDPGSAASTSQTCYSDQKGYVSYFAAQWSSMDTFVTASTTGSLPLRLRTVKMHARVDEYTHACTFCHAGLCTLEKSNLSWCTPLAILRLAALPVTSLSGLTAGSCIRQLAIESV